MTIQWPSGLGAVFGVVVLILAILGMVGVLPTTPVIVFEMLAGLAIARLC